MEPGFANGTRKSAALVGAALIALCGNPSGAAEWDFSRSIIAVDGIETGGPPRDGIPALFNPTMVPAEAAGFLAGDDRILGVEIGGEARAYPIRILSWHELVNDVMGGEPILVSW